MVASRYKVIVKAWGYEELVWKLWSCAFCWSRAWTQGPLKRQVFIFSKSNGLTVIVSIPMLQDLHAHNLTVPPENRLSPKETIVCQPSVFRCKLFVCGRVIPVSNYGSCNIWISTKPSPFGLPPFFWQFLHERKTHLAIVLWFLILTIKQSKPKTPEFPVEGTNQWLDPGNTLFYNEESLQHAPSPQNDMTFQVQGSRAIWPDTPSFAICHHMSRLDLLVVSTSLLRIKRWLFHWDI